MVMDDNGGREGSPGRDGVNRPASPGLGLSALRAPSSASSSSGIVTPNSSAALGTVKTKRIAISAEPTNKVLNPEDMIIKKIEKGSR